MIIIKLYMHSVCDKRSLKVSARLSMLLVLFIIYMYKLIDVVHKSFQDSIFVPKFVYSQYYELPCTKENALSCVFFKTKEKMRYQFYYPLSIANNVPWNWLRLCLTRRHAVLFNELFPMYVFHVCMISRLIFACF